MIPWLGAGGNPGWNDGIICALRTLESNAEASAVTLGDSRNSCRVLCNRATSLKDLLWCCGLSSRCSSGYRADRARPTQRRDSRAEIARDLLGADKAFHVSHESLKSECRLHSYSRQLINRPVSGSPFGPVPPTLGPNRRSVGPRP